MLTPVLAFCFRMPFSFQFTSPCGTERQTDIRTDGQGT